MALQIPKNSLIFGSRSISNVFRTDIFKFTNINLIQEAGPPVGQWPVGSLYANLADYLLYLSVNYKAQNIPDIGWFKMNGSIQDFSGNKNNGTLTGGDFSKGKYANALELDGVDDKVEFPAAMLNGTQNFKFGFWVKLPADLAAGEEIYILDIYKDADEYLCVSIKANATPKGVIRIRKRRVAFGPDDHSYTTIPINLNTWTWVGIAQGGSDFVFVNTTEEANAPGFAGVTWSTEIPKIGYSDLDSSFGDNDFMIDDLRFFNSLHAFDLTFDKINLDINHWRSFSGSFVEAVI